MIWNSSLIRQEVTALDTNTDIYRILFFFWWFFLFYFAIFYMVFYFFTWWLKLDSFSCYWEIFNLLLWITERHMSFNISPNILLRCFLCVFPFHSETKPLTSWIKMYPKSHQKRVPPKILKTSRFKSSWAHSILWYSPSIVNC